MVSLAYLTLKEEGRSQLCAGIIQARIDMLKQAAEQVNNIFSHDYSATTLLAAWVSANPDKNPLLEGHRLAQMIANGKFRLGLRVPVPLPRLGDEVRVSGAWANTLLRTDDPSDTALLAKFAAAVPPDSNVFAAATRRAGAELAGANVVDREQNAGNDSNAGAGATGPDLDGTTAKFVFPRGRLGGSCKKFDDRINALLLALTGDKWQDALREATLRSMHRSVSACKDFFAVE
jgi:hypothetical protein